MRALSIVLITFTQLSLAIAPISETRFGADARAHAEAAGTSVHHAHSEADCAACAARALLSLPNRDANPAIPSRDKAARVVPQLDARPDISARSGARPRAPPLRQA